VLVFGKNNDPCCGVCVRYSHLEPLKDILLKEDKVTEKERQGWSGCTSPNLPKRTTFEFLNRK
jgi:hypothetical protein